MIEIGEDLCIFCGRTDPQRFEVHKLTDLPLKIVAAVCPRCKGGAAIFADMISRSINTSDESEIGASEKILAYDQAAEDFENKALEALSVVTGLPQDDEDLLLIVRGIAGAAVAETCARMLRIKESKS